MKSIRNSIRSYFLTTVLRHSIVGTSQKSYYQIIGVSKTATPKQIRTQFLKKARQLHPDHNPSQQAQQQFKQLKEAYEILKDPQQRYIYDTGINEDVANHNANSGGTWRESGRKYYQNKWYEYKKSNYSDQRDVYYQAKFQEDQDEYQRKLWYRSTGIILVMVGFFGYDYLFRKKSRQDAEKQHIKHIIEGQEQDKRTRRIRRYIQQRAKANQVTEMP